MGLNDNYLTTRGNILFMKPFPSLDKIYSLIIKEEQQRGFSCTSSLNQDNSAMSATHIHTSSEPIVVVVPRKNFNSTGQREPLHCTHYNRKGHI